MKVPTYAPAAEPSGGKEETLLFYLSLFTRVRGFLPMRFCHVSICREDEEHKPGAVARVRGSAGFVACGRYLRRLLPSRPLRAGEGHVLSCAVVVWTVNVRQLFWACFLLLSC